MTRIWLSFYRDLNLNHYRGSIERIQPDGKDAMIVIFGMSLTITAFIGVLILKIFKQQNTIVKRTDRSVEECSAMNLKDDQRQYLTDPKIPRQIEAVSF